MVTLKVISIGVVAANMGDYIRWVRNQTPNTDRRYFPIIRPDQVSNYDEIIVTTTAQTNPNYFDIYVKLNGAYNKARHETKEIAESL